MERELRPPALFGGGIQWRLVAALALLATIILSEYFAKFVDISSGIGLKFHNVYKKHESKKLEVSKLSLKRKVTCGNIFSGI